MSTGGKKPSGSRPRPKRLFSLDSLRKQRTNSESDTASISSGTSHWRKRSNASSNLLALAEKVEEGGDPFADAPGDAWTEKGISQSPKDEGDSPLGSVEVTARPGGRFGRGKVPSLDLSNTLTPPATPSLDANVPPSPSRRRWDTIRSHVMPSSSSTRSATPPPVPTPPADESSAPSTPRPSTPRGVRFGATTKKSMRQVVDQARDVVHDETRRLAEDLRKACYATRFGDLSTQTKPEREPTTQNTIGSTLHLPFLASSSSSQNAGGHARQPTGGLKRPQSVASLNRTLHSGPTVTHITRILLSSPSANRPRWLPYETQVLSALLIPFLGPRNAEPVGEEQNIATDTFEFIIKSWRTPSSETEMDRIIWCCEAAAVPSPARTRILGALSQLLFSRERTFHAETPDLLQTLLQSLFTLLAALRSSPESSAEARSVAGFIAAVKAGQSGTPLPQALEKEYGVRYKGDSDQMVRDIIVAESIIGCLEIGSEASRRWMLHHLLEEYWSSLSSVVLTPLLTTMTWRKLKSFMNASINLLSSALSHARTAVEDADMIIHLLRTRILPEVEAMQDDAFGVVSEIRSTVVRLVLELLRVRGCPDREYLMVNLCHWFQDGGLWKQSVEKSLHDFLGKTEWSIILRVVPILIEEPPPDVRTLLIPSLLPPLTERLMADPPEYPCAPLTELLESIAATSPKAFFKPLFSCAASVKELTIANQLCGLYAVARFYPALWTHDAEMMSVALMTDPKATRVATGESGGAVTKGKARFGQLILVVELTHHLKQVRQTRDPALLALTAKFVVSLEARVGTLLAAKEQHTLVPASQRLLFSALFRECRLLTRSLKPAAWLPSVVNWNAAYSFHGASDLEEDEDEEEILATLNKVQALYEQAKVGIGGGGKRRTTFVTSPTPDPQQPKRTSKGGVEDTSQETFGDRILFLRSLVEKQESTGLELLVTVSGLLASVDYVRLAPVLWYKHLGDTATHVVAPTCFLIMQCAERIPDEFTSLISDDLKNSDAAVRRNAVERLSTISSWRFQLLSQEVILDRTYRRPFKLTRPPILFVPTDIGTSMFEIEEDPNDFKDSKGHVLPLELRRRLSEVGWAEERGEMDPKTQWIKTPVARLPTTQLDSLSSAAEGDNGPPESPSGSPSPEPSPTRSSARDSMIANKEAKGSQGRAKRRPVFVATMVALFPKLSEMVKDSDFVVANTAKNLMLDLMRDEPTVLSRSVFHDLSGDSSSVISAVSTLRNFIHCEAVLPPGMAHHVLNHLAGFLKSLMRQTEAVNALQSYGYVSPIIAKLAPQVSKISMRDIRRAKVDMLFIPSGALWWNDAAPAGPMFPRALDASHNPFETLPAQVIWVTMVRTAQNLLLLNMLRRNTQDVKVIRKNMSTLILPLAYDEIHPEPIPLTAYLPTKKPVRQSHHPSLTALSLTLVRSHLLLLHQVFRCTSRHLNDREELALLLDGLNRIMLAHGDDVGVVSHAMLNYLVASTRFRRLFTSGGGYTLFMPAVIKVYCDAASHPTIRAIIEFAVNRFYALHQESFIFQTCDIMSNVIALPGSDGPTISLNIFTLFSTLKRNPQLHNAEVVALSALTRVEEQEAIMVTIAERVPQAFLASVQRGPQGKNQVTVDVPDEFDSKRLGIDDLVRLFLTVIAHNPTILRAQQFLRFLLFLTPYLYHASASTRSVLRDGISALGAILLNRGGSKTKGPEGSSQVDELGPNTVSQTGLAQANLSQSSFPSDLLVMRLDYLSLVVAFTRAGGHASPLGTQRVLEIVKNTLKESRASVSKVATFLADYMRAALIRPTHPELKHVVTLLTDVAPIISSYCSEVDFSGVFDVIATLASDTVFANQPAFSRVVVSQYCSAGLEACEVAASANVLFLLAIRGSLINLLDKALLLVGADAVAELEKREATYEFLSGVILPLVLRMKTSIEIASDSQWAEKWRRDVYAKAWSRLLVYVLAVIQRAEFTRSESSRTSLSSIDRRRSTDSRTTVSTLDPKPAMALVVALQILKIMITRAEHDLSAALPGIWGHIGSVLRETLADGDASFAIPTRGGYSEPPSPTHSPQSAQFHIPDENPFLTPSVGHSLSTTRAQKRPRIIDYMTWSLIEWLCLRRNPLALQMRIFVQEKVATLHQELSASGSVSGTATPNYNASFVSSSRPRSRPVSNIFSKPRRSFLGATDSAASTPRSSALFTTSVSLPTFDDFGVQSSTPRKAAGPDDGPARQAGYTLMPSPLTPSRRAARDSGPKIVHLGPVRPVSPLGDPAARRSTSPSRRRSGLGVARSALGVAREMTVDAPVLVRATCRRIRVAQAMLGYPALPLAAYSSVDSGVGPGEMGEGPDVEALVRAWSRAEAVEAVVQETKDLIEEWREDGGPDMADDSGILVDVEEPRSGQA